LQSVKKKNGRGSFPCHFFSPVPEVSSTMIFSSFSFPGFSMWSRTRSQTTRSPGMITYASSPVPRNRVVNRISLSIVFTIPQASAGTPSAHVSITDWMFSSVKDEITTLFREKLTKYISPFAAWHFSVTEYVSTS